MNANVNYMSLNNPVEDLMLTNTVLNFICVCGENAYTGMWQRIYDVLSGNRTWGPTNVNNQQIPPLVP
jgi:hypothetical protein